MSWKKIGLVALVLLMVLLAGCSGQSQAEGSGVAVYVSAQNGDIDDFDALNISFSGLTVETTNGTIEKRLTKEIDLEEAQEKAVFLERLDIEDDLLLSTSLSFLRVEGLVNGEEAIVRVRTEELTIGKELKVKSGSKVVVDIEPVRIEGQDSYTLFTSPQNSGIHGEDTKIKLEDQ